MRLPRPKRNNKKKRERIMLNETYRAMLGHKSVIRETFMYGKQRAAEIGYENVFDYSLGNPSVPCPDKFTKTMQTLLAEEEPVALHGYCPSQGDPGFRTAVAAHLAKTFGLPYEQKDIFPTTGAAGAIAHAIRAVTKPGDEVLTFAPYFPEYGPYVEGTGAVLKVVPPQAPAFQPNLDAFEAMLNENVTCVLINTPNNPTGVLYPKEILLEIIQVAREFGLLIFADEIYDRLVMDGKQHISLASLTEDVPVITLNGLSKSHCLCGYRCGWMVISGPRELTEDYRQGIIQLTSLRLCANTMAQIVIPAALDDMETPASMVRPGGRIYEQREATVRELEKIDGLSFVKNDAAFYVFPKLDVKKFNITNDKQFAHDLLDVTNILLVPGSGFDWKDPDHFRIVMLPQADILSDAIRRMGTFLDGYKQK